MKPIFVRCTTIASLCLAISLAGCGGGGSDSGPRTPTATPLPVSLPISAQVKSLTFNLTPTGDADGVASYKIAITGSRFGQLSDNRLTFSSEIQKSLSNRGSSGSGVGGVVGGGGDSQSILYSFTLALVGSQTPRVDDVFTVGTNFSSVSLVNRGSKVFNAEGGQVRVVSTTANALTLRFDNLVTASPTGEKMTFNGTITVGLG